MLTAREVHAFARAHRGRAVLSVYLDARTTDPAMRDAIRPALAAATRALRGRVVGELGRAAFDRAASFLDELVARRTGTWGAPGWVAYVTADGPLYVRDLPVHVPTLVTWRTGRRTRGASFANCGRWRGTRSTCAPSC